MYWVSDQYALALNVVNEDCLWHHEVNTWLMPDWFSHHVHVVVLAQHIFKYLDPRQYEYRAKYYRHVANTYLK